MNNFNNSRDRFCYHVESSPAQRGGHAWRLVQDLADGERVVVATGTMILKPGESWDADELVAFIQAAEALRKPH